jgi:hypothetical protein
MAKIEIRPIRLDGNIAYVPLTRGCEAIIDASDAGMICQFNWRIQSAGPNHKYAGRSVKLNGHQTIILMHRFICQASPGDYIDHVNGNRLDNRRDNIRICTQSENLCNRAKQSNNRSGYKGVYLHAPGVWRSRIQFRGNLTDLGLFNDPEAAHQAYVAAARRLHGEFMRAA